MMEAKGVPWRGDGVGYTCFTEYRVQMQRGGSENLDTPLPLAWDTCRGRGRFLSQSLGDTGGFSGGREMLQLEEGFLSDATQEDQWEWAQRPGDLPPGAVESVPEGGTLR